MQERPLIVDVQGVVSVALLAALGGTFVRCCEMLNQKLASAVNSSFHKMTHEFMLFFLG